MGFSILISGAGKDQVIELHDGAGFKAIIFSFGAILAKFILETEGNTFDLIDGYNSPVEAFNMIDKGFKSAKLCPYACRIRNSRFKFQDQEFKITKQPNRAHCSHGLVYDHLFNVINCTVQKELVSVTLEHIYDNQTFNDGFPFSFRVSIKYTLEKNGEITLRSLIENLSQIPMPLSDGWHPYFKLGDTINNIEMQFSCKSMIEFDKDLVPTGGYLPFSQFSKLTLLGDISLDNSFEYNSDNDEDQLCTILDRTTNLQLDIKSTRAYPILQIYTPSHRKSIAIENLASPPNSFNNQMMLIVLEPKESKEFKTIYHFHKITNQKYSYINPFTGMLIIYRII